MRQENSSRCASAVWRIPRHGFSRLCVLTACLAVLLPPSGGAAAPGDGGARLHASPAGGGAGGLSRDGAATVWIGQGSAPGSYIITATHPVYTNITASAVIDAARIGLEPVNAETDSDARAVNPSGAPLGANGYRKFKIKIEPGYMAPDPDIQWVASGGGVEFRNGVSTGREVWVRATSAGSKTLTVNIKNFVSAAPQINFEAYPQTRSVPVRFMIVSDRFGVHAATTSLNSLNLIEGVNRIFDQVGVEFYIDSISYTNRDEWRELTYDASALSYFPLCSSLPTGGGLEVYMVEDIVDVHGGADYADGFNWDFGLVAASGASAQTIAHEIAHQCGLVDIYPRADSARDAQGQQIPPVSGAVSESRLPDDWIGDGDYYPSCLQQRDLNRICSCAVGAPQAVWTSRLKMLMASGTNRSPGGVNTEALKVSTAHPLNAAAS